MKRLLAELNLRLRVIEAKIDLILKHVREKGNGS